MKNKRKPAARVCALLPLLVLALAVLLLPVSADGTVAGDGERNTENVTIGAESAPMGANGETGDAGTENGDGNFASVLTAFFTAHTTEVFSALALVGTGALAFCYKRGLLPVLRHGLHTLSGGADRLLSEAKEASERNDQRLDAFLQTVTPVLNRAAAVSDCLGRLEEKIAELEAAADAKSAERDRLLVLSKTAVAMLKEVFTAAKLPAASKEELAELYRRAAPTANP